jgi:hypothetical protein
MKTRPVTIPRILVLLILATGLCGFGLRLVSSESNSVGSRPFAGEKCEGHLRRDDLASTGAPAGTPTPTATPFSHPLLFPPVATQSNVSIGIDEACVQVLDGPCTNMWTYGGTYPGITMLRRQRARIQLRGLAPLHTLARSRPRKRVMIFSQRFS